MKAIQRVAVPALQVEIPTAALAPILQVEIPTAVAADSSPDPSVGQEGLQADLDMTVGADASSLDLKAARILSEAVATTQECTSCERSCPLHQGCLVTLRSLQHKKDRVMHV
jgi:hypothetical protein